MKPRRNTARLLVCAALALIVALAVVAFRGVGRWLVREDALAPAGAIVVLSGGTPYRAEEAARVYGGGYAAQAWVSKTTNPASEFARLGIHFTTSEEYDREVLIREGVPASAVLILPDAIVNTEQEVEEIAREMQRREVTEVIIVTAPQHTRRVRSLWARLAPADRKAIIRAAYEEPYDPNHWWRNTRDAISVTHEVFGLVNAWLGLPVRPHGPREISSAFTPASKLLIYVPGF